MKFRDFLSRCDIENVQAILGRDSVRLMGFMETRMTSPTFLTDVLIGSIGEAGLLSDPKYRRVLFDLLRPDEATALCKLLDAPNANCESEPYPALGRASIGVGSQREKRLFDYFEVVRPIAEVDDDSPSTTDVSAMRPLFAHQRRAAREVRRFINDPPHRVLLHMPTGSGKTRTAMSVIADILRGAEPLFVIWVAYSEELCSQAVLEFVATWRAVGDREMALHRFWGRHEIDSERISDGLLIAGLPKLVRRGYDRPHWLGQLGAKCSLLVVDEAHQSVAPHYRVVLDALLVHSVTTGLVGLTATPGRTWNDVTVDEELAKFYSRRKVGLQIPGYDNPVDYLVAEGYLAKASFEPLHHEGGFSLSATEKEQVLQSLDLSDALLSRIGDDEIRNVAIINRVEHLAKRHRRIILFAASVHHSHLLAAVLLARGLKAHAVTTKTASSERTRSIELFKNESDESIVLCNYGVLTTGFDAPRTSCAVIARPTKSLVLYSQMVGRAIRGPKAGGNKEATIVTVVDKELPGFATVSDAFMNWEDIWD